MSTANKTEMQIAIEQQNALLARFRKIRALIVEDSAEARGMLRGFLREMGVEKIDLAASGLEAIDYLKSRQYGIVLCDYNLGKGKDGQQILEEARHAKYLSYSTVFMMITAETTLEMVMGALEYQPDNYLSKPFTRNDLQRRLERAMSVKLEYKDIDKAFEAKDFEATLLLCEEKILQDQKESGAGANRAKRLMCESLLNLKRFTDAVTFYREILAERELAWAKIGLGRGLYQINELDEAKDIFLELITTQPNVVESYDWLAKIQIALGEPRVAQDTLEAAVNRSPKAVLRQMELAKLAMNNRSYLVAEKAAKRSVMLCADSCYRSSDNYLLYVRALLVKVDGTSSKLARDSFKEAQLYLVRLRKDFPDNRLVEFQANLLEGLLCFCHQQFDAADKFIGTAQNMTEQFNPAQRVAVAKEFVSTLSTVDCFDAAEAFVHELQKQTDNPQLATTLRQRIVKGRDRVESENLNREAMQLYEHGKVVDAQSKFSEAAKTRGASPNLLLNAARTCIDLAEKEDLNKAEWKAESRSYLDRLVTLDRCDHRYEEFQALETRYFAILD